MRDIERSVMAFLGDIPSDRPILLETELMQAGVLDSINLVRLIQYLEAEFGISIADEEIAPQIFASPASIAAFVASKTG
jgi:acyl carrier protein